MEVVTGDGLLKEFLEVVVTRTVTGQVTPGLATTGPKTEDRRRPGTGVLGRRFTLCTTGGVRRVVEPGLHRTDMERSGS